MPALLIDTPAVGLKDRIYDSLKARSLERKVRSLGIWLENHELRARTMPHGASILFVSPHQDDESIGAGGTLKLATSRGGRVDVLYTSDGRRGFPSGHAPTEAESLTLVETRKEEAREACRVLGVSDVKFLGAEDTQLHLHMALSKEIGAQLEARHYDMIFAPWPFDQHRDHQSTWKMVEAALREYDRPIEVWLYEVWTPLLPNAVVDISSVIEAKEEAVKKFTSQLRALDYVETSKGLARYRSALIPGSKYAEAFLIGDRAFALQLTSKRPNFL